MRGGAGLCEICAEPTGQKDTWMMKRMKIADHFGEESGKACGLRDCYTRQREMSYPSLKLPRISLHFLCSGRSKLDRDGIR